MSAPIPISLVEWPKTLSWTPATQLRERNEGPSGIPLGIFWSAYRGYWSRIAPENPDHYQAVYESRLPASITGAAANIKYSDCLNNSRSLANLFCNFHDEDTARAGAILQLKSCGLGFFVKPARIQLVFPGHDGGHQRFDDVESLQFWLQNYRIETRLA